MIERIKNYLSITKKEWNGMVILVVLIALVLAAPYVLRLFRKDNVINFNDFDKAVAQLRKAGQTGNDNDNDTSQSKKILHPVMFSFDPNLLTLEQWKQLGLTGKQADVILHYKVKGGHFYKNDDLKKIYVISADDYKRLEPYINIPQSSFIYKKARLTGIIELNNADSAKMTALKGIGPSLAVRILRYRNRLGGFYRKEQLKEINGIDSALYSGVAPQVTVNPEKIKKININTISFDQLRIFPYFNYKQVNAVIQYRMQHGNYNSIADMANIVLLDKITLAKIEPYLTFE